MAGGPDEGRGHRLFHFPACGAEVDAAPAGTPLARDIVPSGPRERRDIGLQAVRAGNRSPILSTTILAVSAHAVVPPFAYSFTASPTFHRFAIGVSCGKS